MSKRLGLMIAYIALFVLVGCGPSPFPTETSVTMVREENTVGQFSFEHPLDWAFVQAPAELQGDNTIVAYGLSTETPNPGVIIVIRKNSDGFTKLTEVRDWSAGLQPPTRHETQISETTQTRDTEEILDREYAWEAASTDLTASVLMRCLDNYRIHNQTAFALSFCAQETDYERLKPTFVKMIDSFQYLD